MKHFRINQPAVIHQNIEGEVVIIHLETGTYYSLTSSAAWIWDRIAAGLALDEIIARLTEFFEVATSEAAAAVEDFLTLVLSEKLILESASAVPASESPALPKPAGARLPFVRPAVEKFTDMQQLLLLDPIHEVDERGWPHQPNANP